MSVPSDLFGRWLHRYEDDEGDVEVYRPASEQFPRSRGREGFEIRPDGEFVHISIGPGDGTVETPGSWETVADDRLRVSLDNGESYVLELVGVAPGEVRLWRR